MADIDLDLLADGYSHRPITDAGRSRARMATVAAGLGSGDLVVDVGGGRGWHGEVFAESGARTIVVDRSPAMALAACTLPGVDAVVADGGALPIADGVARLVYFHASIHYGEASEWLGEAMRVAAPGGVVWVWTFDRESVGASFLARWFPTVAEIDAARFPADEDLAEALVARGARAVRRVPSVESVTRRAGEWVEAVRSGFVSTLQLVPPDEIERGLERFSGRHPDPNEVLSYQIHYRAVWGRCAQ